MMVENNDRALKLLVVGSIKLSYLGLLAIALIFITSLMFNQESAVLALIDGPSSAWFTFALTALVCIPLVFFIGAAIKMLVTMIRINFLASSRRNTQRALYTKKTISVVG